MLYRIAFVLISLVWLAGPSRAAPPSSPPVSVRLFGAGAGGDDTAAFRAAVQLTPPGGLICFPAGNYRVTGVIEITKPLTLIGDGPGSQIAEQGNTTLFRFTGVDGAEIANLYLGSVATGSASLIEFVNTHHSRIENVSMLGGGYGLHLLGSILDTIVDLRSGTNLRTPFFAQTSTNQVWVLAEGYNNISANANTFVAPVLEGGVNGMIVRDPAPSTCVGCVRNGQGSFTLEGGSIEGVSGVGLTASALFMASSVTGTHFEANGQDIAVTDTANLKLTGVTSLSANGVSIGGANNGYFSTNISLDTILAQNIVVAPAAHRIQLNGVTTDLQCASSNNNDFTGFITPPQPTPAVSFFNVAHNCT